GSICDTASAGCAPGSGTRSALSFTTRADGHRNLVNQHQTLGNIAAERNDLPSCRFPERKIGSGMSSRAQYYWRQADICMRLSLLSEDSTVAELLINKAMELMSQAETAAADEGPGDRNGVGRPQPSGDQHH